MEPINVENLIDDKKNSCVVRCKECDSKILNKKVGYFETLSVQLPLAAQKKQNVTTSDDGTPTLLPGTVECETCREFWRVNNMYDFENISFTKNAGSVKYLACADCDIGPIGYFDVNTNESFVALSRVKHES